MTSQAALVYTAVLIVSIILLAHIGECHAVCIRIISCRDEVTWHCDLTASFRNVYIILILLAYIQDCHAVCVLVM